LGSYRDGLAGIVHGLPAEHVLLFFRGHPNAGLIPPGINVFWQQIGIAEQIPHAVGVAWGMQRCQVEAAALTLFGDGATSEGAFHEGLNFAGVLCAPVVFVCQNNGWAISVPRRAQTVSETIAQKAVAYGMPGRLVDGNDVLAVYREVKAALQRAYAGQGPTLLEMVTYRLGPHSTADDPSRYRSASEQLEWQDTRDPLLRLRVYLTRQALWDDEQQQRLEQKLRAEIADAVTTALAAPVPAPETMFEHVYETPSFLLMEQRQELLEYCQSVEKGVSFP
jgi:pyruvate dehydrogenase E1 component alpha subunit